MIRLRGVRKTYGQGSAAVEALKGLDLQVDAGEFVSVMGPSGSGKSTLLNLVSALDIPSAGEIWIAGRNIARLTDDELTLFRRRRIGLVFQAFNLLPTLSAFDNVLLPVKLERRIGAADAQRARELLGQVGLQARSEHRLHQLSGGEMQRVAIARALILSPQLILADEPTGNLDSATGEAILRLLKRTCRDHGTTVVMVTHDARAARTGDRIVQLRDGCLAGDEHVVARASGALE
jgi:putative ABC transport system ATP-binding protein